MIGTASKLINLLRLPICFKLIGRVEIFLIGYRENEVANNRVSKVSSVTIKGTLDKPVEHFNVKELSLLGAYKIKMMIYLLSVI